MDRITEVTRECFDALIQIRRLDENALPASADLRRRLCGFVDALLQKAAQAGFAREEANDIAYAVVALADDIVLSRSALRDDWAAQPLQMHYFHENVAGEAFFTRLQTIRRDPRRREVLQVYYLALLFGFEGKYRVRGGELELLTLTEELQRELARGRRFDAEVLSPQGERPDDVSRTSGHGQIVLWAALATLALLVVLYLGLRVSLGVSADAVVDRVNATYQR